MSIKKFSKKTLSVIYDSIDQSINSIADFEFPFVTHVHSDEQLLRLRELTTHLRDKCDKFLESLESPDE